LRRDEDVLDRRTSLRWQVNRILPELQNDETLNCTDAHQKPNGCSREILRMDHRATIRIRATK